MFNPHQSTGVKGVKRPTHAHDGETMRLPYWPRGLSEEMAAAYCGLSSATLRREMAAGRFPRGFAASVGRVVWDRTDIDEWFDARKGTGQPCAATADLLLNG